MPRPRRKDFEGALHHVCIRGVDGVDIVRGDADRRHLLRLLAGACEDFAWRCLSYCLLDNHLHAILFTPKAGLADGMQRWTSTYVRRFNDAYGRTGQLVEDRYFSNPIGSESYLVAAVRYVAFNPVRAGLCARPEQWPWGGHRYLVAARKSPDVDVSAMFDFLPPARYAPLFDEEPDPARLPASHVAVLRLAHRGFLTHDIAERTGLHIRTVRRILTTHGVTTMSKRGLAP